MKTKKIFYLTLVLCFSAVVLATPSFINNTGGAYFGGNISIGTTQSAGQLHVNGSIYQIEATPQIVGYITDPVKLNGVKNVYVQGKYAYLAAEVNDSLSIIDISNPLSPVIVGSVTDSRIDGSSDVAVFGKFAYVVATNNRSLTVIDVSNSSKPVIVGSVTDAAKLQDTEGLVVSGKYAYVATLTNQSMSIIDVSNPNQPSIVGYITDPVRLAGAFGVSKQGRYAYVSSRGNDSLSVIDVSNASNPVIVGTVSDVRMDGARKNTVSGRYAYVAAGINNSLTIIDVSNVTEPKITSSITSQLLTGARDVFVSGRYAYVTANDLPANALTVVDISVPASPKIVAYKNDTNLEGAFGIFVSGRYAYVTADTNHSFSIIDIGGIDSPAASIGAVETGSLSVTENAVIGNDLYAGNGFGIGPGGIYSKGPASIFISAANSVTAALNVIVNTTTVLFVGTSGNVGINTSSPTSLLHVVGNANITGTLYSGGCVGCTVSGRMAADVTDNGFIADTNNVTMNFTVGANQTWGYEFFLGVNSSSPETDDVGIMVDAPAETNCIYTFTSPNGAVSADTAWQSVCHVFAAYNISTNQPDSIVFHGTLISGNFTGPVTLEFGTYGSQSVTVLGGSYFTATRIG